MVTSGGTVRIQIHSNFDMLDFVQIASDHIGQMAGLDEDSVHWISVAVRESVINAIKHGNREHPDKLVTVEFTFAPPADPGELIVRVLDEGEGFESVDDWRVAHEAFFEQELTPETLIVAVRFRLVERL